MPNIEFIYDRDCPNVEGARTALREALASIHRDITWQEWDRADSKAPAYVRTYGSPTILVDGKDIAGIAPSDAPCCRLYRNETGSARGVPSRAMIATAILTSVTAR